jgi:site-specific DNA-methyltransferase (cytosine-N4-specific)
LDRAAGPRWLSALPNAEYLTQWFPLPVLAQAAIAVQEIGRVHRQGQRAVLLTLLSDTLRDVSYQDPRDLRIRRRQGAAANYALVAALEAACLDRLDRVARVRPEIRMGRTSQRALCDDSRTCLVARAAASGIRRRRFDAVITSPPYANALPYIDTQRLSLCFLGLVSAAGLRSREAALIGNREISRSEREKGAFEIRTNAARLPASVARLCREMLAASLAPENGFRRQNTPSLVYRYFQDMLRVFEGLTQRTKVGAPIALVVGRNRTNLGGRSFTIDTPALLADVACHAGLRLAEILELDAYHRFDMHVRNSIRDEALLLLRR